MSGIPGTLAPHTVTRVRPATSVDAYGNTTLDYGVAAARLTMLGWLQQNSRTEALSEGRDPLVQTWLFLTNDTDILGRDRIEWGGPTGALVFDVDGPPAPVYSPTGALDHIEATLRVVAG